MPWLPVVAIWAFFNGHASMNARGMDKLAPKPHMEDIWAFFNGHGKTDARGAKRLALVLPKKGIWKFYNGHAAMIVRGTPEHVTRLRKGVI